MGKFTFFDFCAGIGAGHVALTTLGGECVGLSEIDPKAEKTYRMLCENGNEIFKNWGDLMQIKSSEIPNFDLMIGGFPCQTFSIVGKRKGMQDGRGQIIFGLSKILKEKKTKFFLLENVKGLANHHQGESIKKIENLLEKSGYNVSWKMLKSSDYGVPQIRERVYFVGVRKDLVSKDFEFQFPVPQKNKMKLSECLIENDPSFLFDAKNKAWETFKKYLQNKYNNGLHNLEELMKEDFLILDTRQSDLRLYRDNCPTLRTGRHGILYVREGKLRKLSGKEALLLQGFNQDQVKRIKDMSNTTLLSQAGNAFTVAVIEAIMKEMFKQLPFYDQFENARRSQRKTMSPLKLTPKTVYDCAR